MARWSLCCDGALEQSCPGAADHTERTGQRWAAQSVFRRVVSCEDVRGERGRRKGQREKRSYAKAAPLSTLGTGSLPRRPL